MAEPMIQKTFKEIANPNRDNEHRVARDAVFTDAMAARHKAVEEHKQATAEVLIQLTTCGVAVGFLSEKVNDLREVLDVEKNFSFREALGYSAPEFKDPRRAASLALRHQTALFAQSIIATADSNPFSVDARFHFIQEMQGHVQKFKETFARTEINESRKIFSGLTDKFLAMCQSVEDLDPSNQVDVARMRLMTNALKSYAKFSMGSDTIQYRLLSGEDTQVPFAAFCSEFERLTMEMIHKIIDQGPGTPPAFAKIHENFRKKISELHEEPPFKVGNQESAILQYFSLTESLRLPDLEPGARALYAEDAELLLLEILDFNRRDRQVAVKALHKLGKSLGRELIPENVDDAYWQTLEGNFAIALGAPLEAKPVKEALEPYVKDIGRRAIGVNVPLLERQLRQGSVEKTVMALSTVIPDRELVTGILATNPQIFLEFQNDTETFRKFVKDLGNVMPIAKRAIAAGHEVSPRQLATSEAIVIFKEQRKQADQFRAAKQECLEQLRGMGFEDPDFALRVLRHGTFNRGTYTAVSARTFDDFARKSVEPSQRINVPECRKALFKAGLLEHSKGDNLVLSRNAPGELGKMITWMRNNPPSADIA